MVLTDVPPASAIASPVDILKPPLKWAGGKRWLVAYLRQFGEWHQERRYVEPFCGGLALPLGLMPQNALLNDMNAHVINFYEHVRRGLSFTIEHDNDSDLYYRHRERFNQLIRDQHDSSD